MASIFSKIIAKEIPAHIVAEDDQHLAFLDVRPLVKGHVLCIPKAEVDYIFDMDEEAYLQLMSFSKRVAKALKKAIPCTKVGISVIGLEVPHAHVHLVPMNAIADMTFTNQRLSFSNDEYQQTAEIIRAEFIS